MLNRVKGVLKKVEQLTLTITNRACYDGLQPDPVIPQDTTVEDTTYNVRSVLELFEGPSTVPKTYAGICICSPSRYAGWIP